MGWSRTSYLLCTWRLSWDSFGAWWAQIERSGKKSVSNRSGVDFSARFRIKDRWHRTRQFQLKKQCLRHKTIKILALDILNGFCPCCGACAARETLAFTTAASNV